MKTQELIDQFTRQINRARAMKNKKLEQQSIVDRELLNLTAEFSIDIWKKIRDNDYYTKRDSLPPDEVRYFILQKVESYLYEVKRKAKQNTLNNESKR